MFHVVLAQDQLQLDRLNVQIAKEQRTYEQRRLTASLLGVAAAHHPGGGAPRASCVPAGPAAVPLRRPTRRCPTTDDGSTADTISDWSKTKPRLGPQQP